MQPAITGPAKLFSSAWSLFKANWKILALISVIPSVGSFIGELGALSHVLVPAVLGGLVSIAAAIFSIAMGPALANAIHRLSSEPGVTLTINGQYKIGFGFFWSVLLIAIINGLVFFGSVFLLVVPAIIVSTYAALYIFTLVVDGKKGFSALTESYSLVRGRWWPVFGRILLLGLSILAFLLVLAGLGFVINGLFGLHVPITHTAGAVPNPGELVLGFIVSMLEAGVMVPMIVAYLYNLYTSLKATRMADVKTAAFKKWLITFICVGIIAIVVSVITVPIVVFTAAKRALENNKTSVELNLHASMNSAPQSSTTGPVEPE